MYRLQELLAKFRSGVQLHVNQRRVLCQDIPQHLGASGPQVDARQLQRLDLLGRKATESRKRKALSCVAILCGRLVAAQSFAKPFQRPRSEVHVLDAKNSQTRAALYQKLPPSVRGVAGWTRGSTIYIQVVHSGGFKSWGVASTRRG